MLLRALQFLAVAYLLVYRNVTASVTVRIISFVLIVQFRVTSLVLENCNVLEMSSNLIYRMEPVPCVSFAMSVKFAGCVVVLLISFFC